MYLLLALCAVAAAVDSQLIPSGKTRYDNYQVLAITPQTRLALRFVHSLSEDLELDMWKETPFIGDEAHLMIPPHRLEEIKTRLTKRNIPFSVYIENVQEGLDEEEASLKKNVKAFDYDQYNTLADIYAEIERLAANCPTGYACSTENIGTTTEGRDLTLLKIEGSGSGRGAIWIDSTIHAREWLAPATVFRFIRRIWNGDSLLDDYDFYFLPIMNPDGYLYTWTTSRMWRKNREANSGSSCIGTDLNRNYATNWGISGASTNPCSDTYRGSSPGSCLETTAVQDYLGSGGDGDFGKTLDAFVSVHTYGNYWLHAWGHQSGGSCVIAADHADLFQVANAAADAAAAAESDNNNWLRGNSCATIYPASGLTLEYAKEPGGCKYTYTPELRGGSFAPPASAITPSDNEFYAAIVAQMAEIEAIEGKR